MKQSYKQIPKKQRTLACRCSLIENFSHTEFVAELWCAKRACGAPWVRKCGKVPISEKLVTTWPYTDRPTDRPPDRPSAPQAYQCLLSHFLATLRAQGTQEKTDCTSMLWLIDSCQNKVPAAQYQLAESRAEVSTHPGRVFFFWSYSLTSY